MIEFLILLAIVIGLGGTVFVVGLQQEQTHNRKRAHAQAHSEQLAAKYSPLVREVKEEEHKRRMELEALKLTRQLVEYGIGTGGEIKFRDVTIKPPRPAERIERVEEAAPLALPAPVPTFRELLTGGTLHAALARGEMLLGYANGQARYGSWLDLYSCAIGGVSGSGKSTTVRFLLFQAILAQARLIMIDPHIHDEDESLAAQFRRFTASHIMPPCDDTTALVLKRVHYLADDLADRKATGRKLPAIVLVVDEFNAVMRLDDVRAEMAALLLDIAQEGRKFGLFAMLLGQRWSQQDIGGVGVGAAIRTSLASMLAHRFTDEEQAKKLIGGRNGPKCLELQTGHYLFRDTNGGLSEMVTPLTLAEDGDLVAMNIAASRPLPVRFESVEMDVEAGPLEADVEAVTKPASKPDESPLDARSGHVRDMLREGLSQRQIIQEIWGVSGGSGYQKAAQELSAIIAKLV